MLQNLYLKSAKIYFLNIFQLESEDEFVASGVGEKDVYEI